MFRLSLRYQLGLALLILNLVVTAIVVAGAYRASRQTLEAVAIREVGRVAESRQRAFLGVLTARQERIESFLASVESLCAERWSNGTLGWEGECVRVALTGFHRSERADASDLTYRGRRLTQRGSWPSSVDVPRVDQIATVAASGGRGEYTMQVFRGELMVRVRFPLDTINTVFDDLSGLGAHGEAFLTDRSGRYLTPPRNVVPASYPVAMTAVERCLGGAAGELIAPDYRGVMVISGFRPVPAIGGGCIVANVTQQDALAAADSLMSFFSYAAAALIVVGGLLSIVLAGVATRPIGRLVASAKAFAAGQFDYPLPEAGSSEIRLLSRTLSTMARAISELIGREQKARLEAEAASRTKDDFLATISHELRTPLSAILGWASILARRPDDPVVVANAAGVIERNARTQSKMIEELLDVSRIAAGNQRLNLVNVPIAALVGSALETMGPAAEGKGVSLRHRIDVPDRLLTVDAQRLQQILWNLVSNAVKFTPRDGRVEVVVRDVDGDTEIRVADTGAGIPHEFLPHVFERFRQADSSTTRTHSGLGLGLAIVRDLVELHGGTVRAESPGDGKGATFIVRLPARPAVAASGTPARRPKPVALSGAHVLIVEDDPDTRDVLRTILEGAGAMVTVAGSARETRTALETVHPDLLIADISMPEEDGYSLMRSIRKLEAGRGRVPAIALTAHARPRDIEMALASGFQLHVAKPIDSSRLVASVATLVEAETG